MIKKTYAIDGSDEECKSVKLPTGEVLYDPVDCEFYSITSHYSQIANNYSNLHEIEELLMEN